MEISFSDVKSTIEMYTARFEVLKAEIELAEMSLKLLESDETLLSNVVQNINNSQLKQKISDILTEYKDQNGIAQKRLNIMELYTERAEMINEIKRLFVKMNIQANFCSLCLENPVDVYLKECGHTYCARCLGRNVHPRCPMCRTPYCFNDVRNLIFS